MSDLTIDEILAGLRLRVYAGDAVYTLAAEVESLRVEVETQQRAAGTRLGELAGLVGLDTAGLDLLADWSPLRDAVATLRARVAELEGALRPFAEMPDDDLPLGVGPREKFLNARRRLGLGVDRGE